MCTACSEPVTPVVVLDIDGTLGNWHQQWFSFAALWFGMEDQLPRWLTYDGAQEVNEFMGVTKDQYRSAKLAFRQGGFKRWMPVFKEAPGFVAMLREGGAEVWLATTRPWMRLDNTDPDTREWLMRQGILYDGLIYDENKFDELLKIVDRQRVVAVLDNEGEQYDRAARAGLLPILRRTSFNRGVDRPYVAQHFGEAFMMIDTALQAWRAKQEKRHDTTNV